MSLSDLDASRANAGIAASFSEAPGEAHPTCLRSGPLLRETGVRPRCRRFSRGSWQEVASFASSGIARNNGLRPTARASGKIRGESPTVLRATGERVSKRRSAKARDRDLPRAARANARSHERTDRLWTGALRSRGVR